MGGGAAEVGSRRTTTTPRAIGRGPSAVCPVTEPATSWRAATIGPAGGGTSLRPMLYGRRVAGHTQTIRFGPRWDGLAMSCVRHCALGRGLLHPELSSGRRHPGTPTGRGLCLHRRRAHWSGMGRSSTQEPPSARRESCDRATEPVHSNVCAHRAYRRPDRLSSRRRCRRSSRPPFSRSKWRGGSLAVVGSRARGPGIGPTPQQGRGGRGEVRAP